MLFLKLLPNWEGDPQGEAVLTLLTIAFKEDNYQAMGATEVLLSCCFPSYCNINPDNLQSLEPETFSAAMKVLDLNYKGFYAHQVVADGAKTFNLLKKRFLQAHERKGLFAPMSLTVSQATH